MWRSVPQTLAASTSTTTSPGPAAGSATSSRARPGPAEVFRSARKHCIVDADPRPLGPGAVLPLARRPARAPGGLAARRLARRRADRRRRDLLTRGQSGRNRERPPVMAKLERRAVQEPVGRVGPADLDGEAAPPIEQPEGEPVEPQRQARREAELAAVV